MPDQLRRAGTPGGPVVLLFHGGLEESQVAVPDWRFAPALGPILSLQRRVAAAGPEVWVLRHTLFGWNGGAQVGEAFDALAAVRAARPRRPIVVGGHSMGARTAVRVASDPAVVGVVALAPWLPAEEPADPLAGKRLRVAHARWDRECPLSSMTDFLGRASKVADVTVTSMGHDVHEMARRGRWASFVTEQVDLLTGPRD